MLLTMIGALSHTTLAAEEKLKTLPTCAILTFEAKVGIDQDQSEFLSDRFAGIFDQIGLYRVVARSEVKRILDEQEFQASGSCSAAECAIEAGQMLGAQYMVYGTMGRVGKVYSINSYIIDVETGARVSSAITDHRGDIEGALTQLMERNVRDLLNVDEDMKLYTSTTAGAYVDIKKDGKKTGAAENDKKSSGYSKWLYIGGGAAVLGGVAIAAGGSGGEAGGGGERESGADVAGTWNGNAGTAQAPSRLVLSQNGASVGGTLFWPGGDTRNVAGSISGNNLNLSVEGGDVWNMLISNDNMSGRGLKAGGGSYALNFSR